MALLSGKEPDLPKDPKRPRRQHVTVFPLTLPRVKVRFINQKARNMVYSARSSLKVHARNTGVNICINDRPDRSYCMHADQFRRAREMVKQKRLHKCWTYRGVVFVKKTNEWAVISASKAIAVFRLNKPVTATSNSQLQRLILFWGYDIDDLLFCYALAMCCYELYFNNSGSGL